MVAKDPARVPLKTDRHRGGAAMPAARQIYGEVESQADLKGVFKDIRDDVARAKSREGLTELYRRAGYLITLTYAPSWREKWGAKATAVRRVAESEFKQTARKINLKAEEIGIEADYDEKWGKMK
jgi:hypothetical protein